MRLSHYKHQSRLRTRQENVLHKTVRQRRAVYVCLSVIASRKHIPVIRHIPRRAITSQRDPRSSASHLLSVPWYNHSFSCLSWVSSQNMEFLTASHSAVSNTLFI